MPYLPGMSNFTGLYSGYLPINTTGKYLHYILVSSHSNPATDPLIVWYNGGPGCSSLLGFLKEHGPYVVEDEEDIFHRNEYSWNREANMLYIESPAGVGFSYCDDKYLCEFTDETSADDNLVSLLAFFGKFPEYKSNELYLSGESYAGFYIPFLAYRIDIYN